MNSENESNDQWSGWGNEESIKDKEPPKLNKENYGIIGKLLVGEPKEQIRAIQDKIDEIEDKINDLEEKIDQEKIQFQTPETKQKLKFPFELIVDHAESVIDLLEMAKNKEKELKEYSSWSQEDLSELIEGLEKLKKAAEEHNRMIMDAVFDGKSSAELQALARDKNFKG